MERIPCKGIEGQIVSRREIAASDRNACGCITSSSYTVHLGQVQFLSNQIRVEHAFFPSGDGPARGCGAMPVERAGRKNLNFRSIDSIRRGTS
ncbi:hypothetical protein KYK29_12585 [Shinella daejeonensis]|uniref:hypothetical protein n=1 Tax=Shinella daejeonensis TaxID=659017 RepID=UPI0020C75957|nr:hypothetical protein [Shinella daejeonensis]MCP8895760.1 hypothetical protein [Shinella daejeonensis]